MCGAVTFELTGDLIATAVCHCDHCQRQSGGAFSVNLVAHESQLTVNGELRTYEERGELGDDVYVLLSLPDDPQRYPVAGKVAWITPARASANRTQGVGVRFPGDEKSRLLKLKIEEVLGSHLVSDRPTQTL